MNKVMYKVCLFVNPEIEKKTVTKETDKSIWFEHRKLYNGELIEGRELKETQYYKWFESLQDAETYIITRLEYKITKAKDNLKSARDMLIKFNAELLEKEDE